jgi:hypothetical protein
LHFWNQHKILRFLIPIMWGFEKKFFGPLLCACTNFWGRFRKRTVDQTNFCLPFSPVLHQNEAISGSQVSKIKFSLKIDSPYSTANLQDAARTRGTSDIRQKLYQHWANCVVWWRGTKKDVFKSLSFSLPTLLQMLMEILAVVEQFPMNNCEVSFKEWKKVLMKCMGILPLMSCNKTIEKIFPWK